MIIETVIAGSFDTNAYLVGFKKTGEAIVIDPGYESADSILGLSDEYGFTIKAIYLTHSHFDHFADVGVIKDDTHVPVYVSPEDAENLRHPGSDGLPNLFGRAGIEPDGLFFDGDEIEVGGSRFKVIATPGHSPGSVCFYFEKEKVLFSGDTLFRSGRGNTSFPTSSQAKIEESLKKLMMLPGDTIVYPGHGGKTTIGEERKWFV
jgi:glyoxylase-like metal-dependent hydrolase (beta-lactamase superfamily II)